MKTNQLLTTMTLLAMTVAAGCSVRGGHVNSNPPDIQPRLQSLDFGVEYGMLQSDKYSILIWPNEWTPKQRQEKTIWIKMASNQAIEDLVLISAAPARVEKSFAAFQAMGCIEKYRVSQNNADCDAGSCQEAYDVAFKDLGPMNEGDPGYQDYKKQVTELDQCKTNQDDRRKLEKLTTHLNSADPADFVELKTPADLVNAPTKQIEQVVNKYLFDDDIYPTNNPITTEEKLERAVMIKEKKGLIVVYPPERNGANVMLSVLGIRGAKVCHPDPDDDTAPAICKDLTQSNDKDVMKSKNGELNEAVMIHDVKWDQRGRKLDFVLPDATSQFNSVTGKYAREYHFILERVKNIVTRYMTEPITVDLAKFTGDIELIVDGKVARKGSAQILGAMKAFPPPEPTPTPEPTPVATPEPTPEPSATPAATPEPTPEQSPEPKPSPAP